RSQDLSEGEQALIHESIACREDDQEREEQRRREEVENTRRLREAAEERAKAEEQRAAEQVRRVKVLRLSMLALAGLSLATVSDAVFAARQGAVARARELAFASALIQENDPELAVLIAAQAVAATWRWGHAVLPEAENQLHSSILASHITMTL